MKEAVCHIVGAVPFGSPIQRADGDMVIAADGGYETLKNAGLRPEVCIGDFDSLGYVPELTETIRLPVEKDDTDLIAAIREGLKRGYRYFKLYGVLGGARFSHSIAAIQSLYFIAEQGARGEIDGESCRVFVISDETITFSESARGSISVFSLSDTAVVTLKGLKYSVSEYPLKNNFPLGVSNSFTGNNAEITIRSGTAIVIIELQNND